MARSFFNTDWEILELGKTTEILISVCPYRGSFVVSETCSDIELNVSNATDKSAEVAPSSLACFM